MAARRAARSIATDAEVAAAVVAQDAQLRARLVRIYNKALDDVEQTFDTGYAKDRAVYVRQIVPIMMRGLQEAEAAQADAELQAAFERVMAAVRGDPDPPPAS